MAPTALLSCAIAMMNLDWLCCAVNRFDGCAWISVNKRQLFGLSIRLGSPKTLRKSRYHSGWSIEKKVGVRQISYSVTPRISLAVVEWTVPAL